MKRQVVIFNDIDGIMLDTDSHVPKYVIEVLNRLKELNIPLVLTSTRTRSELEFYRQKLEILHPFISENGGGLFVPNDYFPFSFLYSRKNDKYKVIELGIPYLKLRRILKNIELKVDYKLNGFGDMTSEEISRICEIPQEDAKLAKMRDYEEPFILDDPVYEKEIFDRTRWAKVNLRKESNLYYLTGDNDKGKAIKLLIGLYEKEYGNILAVGICCRENEESLFSQVQIPILLPDINNNFPYIDPKIKIKKGKETGPRGWEQAVLSVISRFAP